MKNLKPNDKVIIGNDSRVWNIDTINSCGFHATTVEEPKRCLVHIFSDVPVHRVSQYEDIKKTYNEEHKNSEVVKTFDEVFKDAYDFCIDDDDYHVREAAEALADAIWEHQQSKITLLENRNEYLTKTNGELAGLILDLRNHVDAALSRADQACIGNEMFHKQFDDVISILRGIHKPKDGAA